MQDQREPTLDERTEGTFALEMRVARTEKKLSQAALAQELELRFGIKLDATAITRMERAGTYRGHETARAIRLGEAVAIADILDLSLSDLLKPDLATQIKNAAQRLSQNRQRAHRIREAVEESEDAYLELVLLQLHDQTDLTEIIQSLLDASSLLEDELSGLRSKLIKSDRRTQSQRIFRQIEDTRSRLAQNRNRKKAIISRLIWSPKYDDISGFKSEHTAPGDDPVRERMAELATLEFLSLNQEEETDGLG